MYNYTEKQIKWLKDNGFELQDDKLVAGYGYNYWLMLCDWMTFEICFGDIFLNFYTDSGFNSVEIRKLKEAVDKYYDLACEWEKLKGEN